MIKKAKGKLKKRTEKLDDFINNHPDMRRDYARTRISEEYKARISQKDLPTGPLENHNGSLKMKGLNKVMVSSTDGTSEFRIYTGKIINNCEELRPLATELLNLNNHTAQQMLDLISGQEQRVVVATLNQRESSLYSRIARSRLGEQPSVIMRQNDMRHLLNSGHLTGITSEGERRIRRLTAQDLVEIKQVIKHPDSVIDTVPNPRNGNKRILLEKQIEHNHRLILEIDRRTGQLRAVTYFNIRRRRNH